MRLRLKELGQQAGLSQRALEMKSTVRQGLLSYLQSGQYSASAGTLQRLADALNVSVAS